MSNNPKRQHYLAQAIQRNFLKKGANKLWWYSRSTDQYEERTPYGIAHGRHIYTFSTVKSDERYVLEQAFSKIEDQASLAFKKLEAFQSITQAEHNAIAEFVGFQFWRTPSKITQIQKVRDISGVQLVNEFAKHLSRLSEEDFNAYIAEYEVKTGKKMSSNRQDLIHSLKNRPPKVRSTKEATLESLVKLGTDLSLEYSKRSWVVLHAPLNSSFITSSEGLFIATDRALTDLEHGPAAQDVLTIFPFSRKAALVIKGEGLVTIRHALTDKMTVRTINDSLAEVSGEIYGSPRRLLESIVKRNKISAKGLDIQIDEDRVSRAFSKYSEQNANEIFPLS